MSRCQSHGELVGGFVLDALEPAEMEEMRNHVASCPACGREARAMAGLPALLDQIDPSDIPPPALSPDVEEAVLDRFARERPKPAAAPRRRRRLAAMAGALALVAVAVVAIFTALASDDEPGNSAYATATARAPGRRAPRLARPPTSTRCPPEPGSGSGRAVSTGRGQRSTSSGACEAMGAGSAAAPSARAPTAPRRAELTAAVKPGDYH